MLFDLPDRTLQPGFASRPTQGYGTENLLGQISGYGGAAHTSDDTPHSRVSSRGTLYAAGEYATANERALEDAGNGFALRSEPESLTGGRVSDPEKDSEEDINSSPESKSPASQSASLAEEPLAADAGDIKAMADPPESRNRLSLVGPATAISFVRKLRIRMARKPSVLKMFTTIVHSQEQLSLPLELVSDQITLLLKAEPDLVEHFRSLLPDLEQISKAFIYRPLDFSRFETRFVRIHPLRPGEKNSSVVSCDLLCDSLIAHPVYVALSYCWGDGNVTRAIEVEGCAVQVTTNLEAALRELRSRGLLLVWCDAISINQEDHYERSYQVSRMGSIYSRAAKVIAWLGEADQNSDEAMRMLSDVSKTGVPTRTHDVLKQRSAIRQLLARPYWHRVWIIQELAKAASVDIWCGHEMLEWSQLFGSIREVEVAQAHIFTESATHLHSLQYFCDMEKVSQRGKARMLLSHAMLRTHYASATDSRDKVYALLDLTRDGAQIVPLPNYHQDPEEVFRSVSRYMIGVQSQTSLVMLAGKRYASAASATWLPLWRNLSTSPPPPWVLQRLETSVEHSSLINVDRDVLEVPGFCLAFISSTPSIGGPSSSELTIIDTPSLDYQGPSPNRYEMYGPTWPLMVLSNILLSSMGSGKEQYAFNLLDRSYALAALFSPGIRTRICPHLRAWYDSHKHHTYSQDALEAYVKAVARAPETLRWRKFIEQASEAASELQELETGLAVLESHEMNFSIVSGQFRIMHRAAQRGDCIFRLQNCALPIILRPEEGDAFSVVAEMLLIDDGSETYQNFAKRPLSDSDWQKLKLV